MKYADILSTSIHELLKIRASSIFSVASSQQDPGAGSGMMNVPVYGWGQDLVVDSSPNKYTITLPHGITVAPEMLRKKSLRCTCGTTAVFKDVPVEAHATYCDLRTEEPKA